MTRSRSSLACATALVALAFPAREAAAQEACAAPERAVLAISTEPVQVAPGEQVNVGVAWFVGGYRPPDAVPAECVVRWSVEPASAGRVIDGKLSATAARPGSRFTLVARVGQSVARQTVNVVAPGPHPFAGYWSQADSATCTGGAEGAARPEPIRELIIRRDSAFSLTAAPFESYRDYWGRYSADPAAGTLRFTTEGGNAELSELKLDGTARVQGDTLTLAGFWLGAPRQPRDGRTCTYLFTRRGR